MMAGRPVRALQRQHFAASPILIIGLTQQAEKMVVRVRKSLYIIDPSHHNKNKYCFSLLKGSRCKTKILCKRRKKLIFSHPQSLNRSEIHTLTNPDRKMSPWMGAPTSTTQLVGIPWPIPKPKCSGLNGGPQKICAPRTSECDLRQRF